MSSRILVIEDDQDINQLICMNLSDMKYDVESCGHGEQGFMKANKQDYDLIVLDLMLPGLDGLEICQKLRAQQDITPILMVTARDSELDRVVGLEMGADDYLSKPFSIRELQARVKAMLRRNQMMAQTKQSSPPPAIEVKDLKIEINKRQVWVKNREVELTSTEFDLLLHLAQSPGQVFSRTQLLDQVWGYNHCGYEHTVNSHINRLRTKLEADPTKPDYVLTVWGVGYKFHA